MIKEAPDIGKIISEVYSGASPKPDDLLLSGNPFIDNSPGTRPNSAAICDPAFGDSGKGRIVQEINSQLIRVSPGGVLYSERYNGTRNAGHEIIVNGKRVALHQLPVAVMQEGAIAIMGRGMLVHPVDLVTEIDYARATIGSELPGTLVIDAHAVVTTDLHSAFETFTNKKLDVGHGATGSGVAQGYASYYEKRAVTMADLVSAEWREKFAKQYHFYADLMGGADVLASMPVNHLDISGKRQEPKPTVGSEKEFLDKLEFARSKLMTGVTDTMDLVENVWKRHPEIPFTFEAAQGDGLNPYYGVNPDFTASRPMGRVGIPDSTEGVVLWHEIAVRAATMKVPYTSSVGARIPPYAMDPEIASMYRTENDETGRSTGRDRGIYPIDLVMLSRLGRVADYTHLAITHLDANHSDIPVEIVSAYVNRQTGLIDTYRPYQHHWDNVTGVVGQLPSWDGSIVAGVNQVEDLPEACLRFINLLGRLLAPAVLGTNGPGLGQTISFVP